MSRPPVDVTDLADESLPVREPAVRTATVLGGGGDCWTFRTFSPHFRFERLTDQAIIAQHPQETRLSGAPR
jgi:hypothetical protein